MRYWSVTRGHPLLSRVGVETHAGWDVKPAHAFSGHMPRLVHTLSQHSSWLTLPAETAEAAAADAERVWRVALGVPLDAGGCPFCGGEGMPASTPDVDRIQHVIRCRSCAAEGPWRMTPEGALDAWRRRV